MPRAIIGSVARRRVGKTVERYADGRWNVAEHRSFVYDGWNLIHETACTVNGGTTNVVEVQYFWGPDISGTLQGAGGVGGLVAVSRDGQFYFPVYDNNGNILKYSDETGNVVAAYEYDDFGRIISQSGPLADFFRHRFSTKYYDAETGLYYYGYRFYHPILMRWLNRDPIEENGGYNVYVICNNSVMQQLDYLGLYLWYVLYYDENKSGSNFKRAAETRKRLIETSSAFNSNCDSVEMYSIRTDNDFFNVWNTLNAHSRKKSKRVTRFQVKGLYLYTHSGPGQLFLRNSTANSLQIKKLPPLNWALQAEIQCLGCNSGVENGSGDSLAGSFYESQKVPTLGQAAASTFSSNPNNKSKWGVVLGFSEVYLWAFDDKGNRIDPIRYPKK